MENLTKILFKSILNTRKFHKIYFDFDGTIVNSAQRKKNIFLSITYPQHHKKIAEILLKFDGLNREIIIDEICKNYNYNRVDLMTQFHKETENIYNTCDAFTHFKEFSEYYPVKLGIISSSDSDQIERWLLNTNNRKYITEIATPVSKKNYLKNEGNVLLFGDGKQDFECSRLSNVSVVYVSGWNDNFKSLNVEADYSLEFLHELI